MQTPFLLKMMDIFFHQWNEYCILEDACQEPCSHCEAYYWELMQAKMFSQVANLWANL